MKLKLILSMVATISLIATAILGLAYCNASAEPNLQPTDSNDPNAQFIIWDWNEPSYELSISTFGSCFGWVFTFDDVNMAESYFANITDYNCENNADIQIEIGDVEKTFTATEFFSLLGFDFDN